MIALDKGHIDVVKTLIEAGANVNETDKVSVCALLYIEMLSTTTTLDCLVLKYLLVHLVQLFLVLYSGV